MRAASSYTCTCIADTGFGNLYASGALGHLFSLSLPRHFYPNFLGLHDFTRVKSMRGVLIATQMYDAHEYPQKRQSMRTVISYNKGATWQPLPAPTNERTCDNRDSNIPVQHTSLLSALHLSSTSNAFYTRAHISFF